MLKINVFLYTVCIRVRTNDSKCLFIVNMCFSLIFMLMNLSSMLDIVTPAHNSEFVDRYLKLLNSYRSFFDIKQLNEIVSHKKPLLRLLHLAFSTVHCIQGLIAYLFCRWIILAVTLCWNVQILLFYLLFYLKLTGISLFMVKIVIILRCKASTLEQYLRQQII